MNPFEAEEYCLPPSAMKNAEYRRVIGPQACAILDENARDQIPTALGWHHSTGYFILVSAGQGPGIVWQERCS